MATIKKYLVCALLFNTISLCAMNPVRQMIVAEWRERVRAEDSQDNFSKYDHKTLIEKMLIRIDLRHLDIIKYCYWDSLIGLITSYWHAYNISIKSTKKAAEELKIIGRYIPKNHDQKKIFKELIKKHWYVYYLVQTLIKKKTKEFFEVNGSTIDQLYDPQFPNTTDGIIDKIIYKKACQSFLSNNDLDCNQSLMDQIDNLKYKQYKDSKDINCMVLYGYTKSIFLEHLDMSADNKYIKLNDTKNDIIIWDMKTGDKPILSQTEYNAIQWSPNRKYHKNYSDFFFGIIVDGTENYCATTNKYVSTGEQGYTPIKINLDKSAIIVYKCPEPLLCLCKIAFKRNKHNSEELIALKNSNSFKAIEGFPRKNFEHLIEKKINRLTLTQHVSNIQNS